MVICPCFSFGDRRETPHLIAFWFPQAWKSSSFHYPCCRREKQFSFHHPATQDICWDQKLHQTEQQGEAIHVLSRHLLWNSLCLIIWHKSINWMEVEWPKTFWELLWWWWFQKIKWMFWDFRVYWVCQLSLLQMSMVWILDIDTLRLMLNCSCSFLDFVVVVIAAMVRC